MGKFEGNFINLQIYEQILGFPRKLQYLKIFKQILDKILRIMNKKKLKFLILRPRFVVSNIFSCALSDLNFVINAQEFRTAQACMCESLCVAELKANGARTRMPIFARIRNSLHYFKILYSHSACCMLHAVSIRVQTFLSGLSFQSFSNATKFIQAILLSF